jgi:hypothetical protein
MYLTFCYAGRFATDNAYAILEVVPCAKVKAFQQAYLQQHAKEEVSIDGEILLPPIQGSARSWFCKHHPLTPTDFINGQHQCRECANRDMMTWIRVEAQIATNRMGGITEYTRIIIAHDMVISLWPELDVDSPTWYQDAAYRRIAGTFVIQQCLLVEATLADVDAQ